MHLSSVVFPSLIGIPTPTTLPLPPPGPTIAPVAPVCLQQLSQLLLAVCKNPTQPGFNHYLFESVAALVRFCCPRDPASVAKFEEMLFPPFQIVLQEDVQVGIGVSSVLGLEVSMW